MDKPKINNVKRICIQTDAFHSRLTRIPCTGAVSKRLCQLLDACLEAETRDLDFACDQPFSVKPVQACTTPKMMPRMCVFTSRLPFQMRMDSKDRHGQLREHGSQHASSSLCPQSRFDSCPEAKTQDLGWAVPSPSSLSGATPRIISLCSAVEVRHES